MLRRSLPLALAAVLMLQPLDAGAGQWFQSTVPTVDGDDVDLQAVFAESATRVFAVGRTDFPARGVIFQGDGSSWSPLHIEEEANHGVELYDVWSGGGQVFVVGEATDLDSLAVQPFILQSGGGPFTRTNVDAFGEKLRGVWGRSASDVYAVGTGFTAADSTLVLRFDGASWAPQTLPDSTNIFGLTEVWGTATDLIVMGCCDQLRFDGTNWTLIFPEPFGIWNGLWGTTLSDVYAVGWDNFALDPISVFYDGTASSTMFSQGAPAGLNNPFEDVWAHPSAVLAVGANAVYRLSGGGWSEETIADGTTLLGIHGSDGGSVYAVGRNRVVLSMQIPVPSGLRLTAVSGATTVDGADLPPGSSVDLDTGVTPVEAEEEISLSCDNLSDLVLITFANVVERITDNVSFCAEDSGSPKSYVKCLDSQFPPDLVEKYVFAFVFNSQLALEEACEGNAVKGAQPPVSAAVDRGVLQVDATGSSLGVELVGAHAAVRIGPGEVADFLQEPDDQRTAVAAREGTITVVPSDPDLDPIELEADFEVAVDGEGVLPTIPAVLFFSSFEE